MLPRQSRTKGELEELCLMALQGHIGLNHLDYVRVGPYLGPENWTWELVEAGPTVPEPQLKEAVDAVRTFQEHFDLKNW